MTPSPSRRRLARTLVLPVLVVSILLSGALPALAARKQSDLLLVREGDVIEEDLYAGANAIQIDGTIEGDLLASAADTITIAGVVDGSVTAIASRIVVSGEVTGSLRVVTPDLVVTGTVGGDVLTAAWKASVDENARIGRDLLVWARDADLRGVVGRNLEGQQSALQIGGVVDGVVEVTVTRLTVLPATQVRGDLIYTSSRDAVIDESASIDGNVIDKRQLPVNVRIRAIWLLVVVLTVIAMTALGLAVVWVAPDRANRAAIALRERPLTAVGWGLGVVAVPIAALLLAVIIVSVSPRQTGIPLIAVLAPLVGGLMSLVAVAALAAPVPAATAVGALVSRGRSIYATFLAGFTILVIGSVLPWIGSIVVALVVVAGLGGWVLSGDHPGEEARADLPPPIGEHE